MAYKSPKQIMNELVAENKSLKKQVKMLTKELNYEIFSRVFRKNDTPY